MNEYEKRFVEHIERLGVDGESFSSLVKQALEGEYGGEVVNLLNGLSPGALGSPRAFAKEMYKTLGTGALQYFVAIIKYAESPSYNPEEESEEQSEESTLESLVHDIDSDPE